MQDDSWLQIDLRAIADNARALLALMQPPEASGASPSLCGVVKKDAYGLGAETIAHTLTKAGCTMLAVYSADEAEQLIQKAVTTPILLLSPLRHFGRTDGLYRHAVADRLHLTVHDLEQIDQIAEIGQTFGIRLPLHLHLDTGMTRSGLTEAQFAQALKKLTDHKHARLHAVYSHLATADGKPEFAERQLDTFERIVSEHAELLSAQKVKLHIANTAGVLRDRRYHFDMARVGLGLWGYGPEQLAPGPVLADAPKLTHAVRWMSRVNQINQFERGAAVGYGRTHRLKRKSTLGVVPVGYGDGYPLGLSNKSVVRVFQPEEPGLFSEAKVLGRISMDQIVIDLTDAPDPASLSGALVELYSDDPQAPNSVPSLAELCKSHPWEMLTRLSPRLKRVYQRA